MYPTKIEVNGKIYELDTDFRTAIACFRVINDKELSDFKRGYAILTLLIKGKFDLLEMNQLLEKCAIYLRCGKESNMSKEKIDVDYVKDEARIRTSIRQCYFGYDLNKVDYLHWWEYNELIEGLTEETLLSKVRDIRNYDLSEEKDPKRRQIIFDMKKQVALEEIEEKKLTEEEEKNVLAFDKAMGF